MLATMYIIIYCNITELRVSQRSVCVCVFCVLYGRVGSSCLCVQL